MNRNADRTERPSRFPDPLLRPCAKERERSDYARRGRPAATRRDGPERTRGPAKSEKPISMVPCAIRQSHLRLDAGVNCVTAEFERIKGKFPVGMHTYVIDMPDGGFQVG